MAKFDSIIFDIDGTIWNTTPVVAKGWNKALREVGITDFTITAERLQGLFGLPMNKIVEDILPNETEELRQKFTPLSFKYEHEAIEEESGIVYDGLIETIDALSKKLPLFIVSNCQSNYTELMLRKTRMEKFFKDYTCYGDTGKYKAENIRTIIERNNLKNPVYVGDTQMDAEACNEAGVPIIYAAYGFGKIDAPYKTISTPKDLLLII